MTERTRDATESASAESADARKLGAVTRPPGVTVVGANGWSAEELAAEEARCAEVWNLLWESTNEFAQAVAGVLARCPPDELVMIVETSRDADGRGFLVGYSTADRVCNQLDIDPAGYNEETKRGIAEQIRAAVAPTMRKIVIRFAPGVIAVRGAEVTMMGKGGSA